MSHRTQFAGLSAPDPGEDITVDNGDFIYRNPDLTDQLLRVGAIAHHHDDHSPIVNPQDPVALAATGSAGNLPGNTTYFVTYTAVDQYGGETAAAPAEGVTTPAGLSPPTFSPSAQVTFAAGIMPAGNYAYAVTWTDGAGGETSLGPTLWVNVEPGHSSAQVVLAGLSQGLVGSGGAAVSWRLWRSYEGEDWHLVTQNTTDTFTDTGFDPPDNPARPPAITDVLVGSDALIVTLPAASAEPAFASASSIKVYLSTSQAMLSPCSYTTLPIACAGATFLITTDSVMYGQPPKVSMSLPGAPRINPETDILNFHWRTPVSTYAALPSGAQGDVRMTLDTGHLWGVLNPSGATAPSGWTDLFVFADPDVPMVASAGTGSAKVPSFLGFTASGEATVNIVDLGGGSAVVTIAAPSAVSSFLASASGGVGKAVVTRELEFAGSGVASCSVTDLGNGSAVVTVTVAPVAGPQGAPGSAANFTASAGSASATVGAFLGFAASGGAGIQLINMGGGSSIVLVGAATSTGGGGAGASVSIGASAGASAVSPASYIEFDASGGIGLAVSSSTGGSATVTIGAPPTKLRVGARDGYSYSVYGTTSTGHMAQMGVNPDGTPFLLAGNNQSGAGTAPADITCSPDGFTVYELDQAGVLAAFSRHADGTLTLIQSISGITTPYSVVVSPDGQNVYVSSQNGASSTILVYRRNVDGTLTSMGTAAFPGASTPWRLCPTPDGQNLYVTNLTAGYIGMFKRNSDGSLISLGTLNTTSPLDIQASPDSKNVYVAQNAGSPNKIQALKRNADGTLTSLGTVNAGTDNRGLAVSPDGLHVYSPDDSGNKVYQYIRNSDGTLTANGTNASNNGGYWPAISPDGQFVYIPNANTNGLQCYRRNASDGTLAYLGNYITSQFIGAGADHIVVSPIAQSVFAANDLELIGSGGIVVTMGSGSTGSAAVVIAGTLPTVAGSGGITPVQPDYYTEYAGSGGISVTLQNMGSGSARVLIGPGDVGTATLAAGTVTVNDPRVTAGCMIFLTAQDNNTTGALRVSARVAGTSFTITSSVGTDTGLVAYRILGN